MERMELGSLTAKDISDMMIEQYERKYVDGMDEVKAISL